MAYATVADVQARYDQDLTTEQEDLVAVRLEDAERIIKVRIPDLDQRIVDGVLDEASVIQVESDMVLRLLNNPIGVISELEGNYQYQLNAELSHGRLSVLDDEWDLLGASGYGMTVLAPVIKIPWASTEQCPPYLWPWASYPRPWPWED